MMHRDSSETGHGCNYKGGKVVGMQTALSKSKDYACRKHSGISAFVDFISVPNAFHLERYLLNTVKVRIKLKRNWIFVASLTAS